jgi:cytochrome c-type biogenesis protein CcmH/NrfG
MAQKRTVRPRCAAVLLLLALGGCASAPRHRDPAAVLALERQAAAAYEQGDMTQALYRYRDLLRNLPDDDGVWFRLGNIYAKLDQPQDAIEAYQRVLQHDGSNAKAWHNLGVMLVRQAQAAFAQSAQAARHDDALRDDSLAMAGDLARLGRSAATGRKAAPAEAPPAPAERARGAGASP